MHVNTNGCIVQNNQNNGWNSGIDNIPWFIQKDMSVQSGQSNHLTTINNCQSELESLSVRCFLE